MNSENKTQSNPWHQSDEQPHPDSMIEWWCAQAVLNSPTLSDVYSFKSTLTQWNEHHRIGSIFHQTLHKQHEDFKSFYQRDETKQLTMKKDPLQISFSNNQISGTYPDYRMSFHDTNHDLHLDLSYHAEVLPHWVAQDSTNGWLPMGVGVYRYGFIPRLQIEGILTLDDIKHQVNGTGYYEHVWGDFLYDKPIANITGFSKTLATYIRLFYWRMHHLTPSIPKKISICTENNPFGYDWVWAKLDNNWTIFFGNILFWLMNGPVAGILVINKDDGSYEELGNITFQYHQTRSSKTYDFIYPSAFEITAYSNDMKLHLCFSMTGDTHEYIARFPHEGFYHGFVICEAPGEVKGYIERKGEKTPVNGICKIEPQRQLSKLGHNMITLEIGKYGFKKEITSHFLNKKIDVSCMIKPRPNCSFHNKRIEHKDQKRKNTKD